MTPLEELAYQVSNFMFFVALLLMTLLLFLVADRLQRIADRYRLKYGFDKEIESKEIGKDDSDLKIEKRERRFKRRVFKD